MERKQAKELIDKYIDGRCSPGEKQLVEDWYDQLLEEEDGLPHEPDWQNIKETIFNRLPPPEKHITIPWLSIAACFLFLSLACLFLWKHSRSNHLYSDAQTAVLIPSEQVLLDLSDGASIVLDHHKEGIKIDSVSIRYFDGTLLSLSESSKKSISKQGMVLRTPVGRQFQIILEDSTKVVLNASSSLRYPLVFPTSKRQVSLEGEGFFEVTKNNSKPFYVNTALQEIKVLGTSFGVNAYPDEAFVKTTLRSGIVRVKSNHSGRSSHFLTPGEQSVLLENGLISKEKVDVFSELSWVDGNFSFHSEDIHAVMRKLQRWYNIDVQYEAMSNTEKYNGVIARFEDVAKVLAILEKTNSVHFKIDGRRITVME